MICVSLSKTYRMHKLGKYRESDRMSDLINDNYNTLSVLSRFNIPLGFEDREIGQVCRMNGVDTATFLAVVNMLADKDGACDVKYGFSLEAMMGYLHSAHDYFLDFRLPSIRTELTEALKNSRGDISQAIMRFFDDYCDEVRKHMEYEELNVFPYVRGLIEGRRRTEYNIAIFRKQHDQVEAKLAELKNIIIKYYPGNSTNELNAVLFDIFSCEQDLASHNRVEDALFVPAIVELEKNG